MPRETSPFTKTSKPARQGSAEPFEEPVISPEQVFRIEGPHHPSRPGASYAFKITVLLIIFALLAGGGILLMHYLSTNPIPVADTPDKKPTPRAAPRPPDSPVAQEKPPPPVDPEAMEAAKRDADQSMTDFINAREDLDTLGGAQWGGKRYLEMEEAGRQADALYLKKEYGPASGKYGQALAMVKALRGDARNALLRLVDEGNQALEAGEGKRAEEKFTQALMIDPSNKAAQRGRARADKAAALARLLASGQGHEDRKNLAFALLDYDRARKLDPESTRARQSYQRVRELIAEDAFRKYMSRGVSALHRGDFKGARTALGKARGLRPESQEAREAWIQLDQAERLAKMRKYQREALEAEQSEDWAKALESYQAVLEIDPRVQFALQGKERSLGMIRLSKRLAYYLDKPEVLESDAYLEKAIQLLAEAERTEATGPQLTARVEELRLLVQAAQVPLKVTLESDNLTQVAVYRVGRLGAFFEKELTLRPGTYTIVGTRSGYKDVRQQVVIKPGKPLRVTIICREKI